VLTVEIKRDEAVRHIQWKAIGNVSHKCRGPAYTHWYQNGRKYSEEYRVNGKIHRDPLEGPAYTHWYTNGQIKYEEYWEDGKLIRTENYQC